MTDRVASLLGEMTLEEKVSMAAGSGPWHTVPIPRLGIPALKVTDGPNGARGDGRSGASAVCFPCGSALAATWDPDLVREVGIALGEEAKTKGGRVLLAPTVNLHRTPLGGRNFECYAEDPYLTARLAVGFVEGVQSTGVGTSVKHFVANDQEFERHTVSSEVDERTLREVYLQPFEAAGGEAGAWTVMASYNRINGTYACSNHWLLTDLLKDEWGFDGVVVSDWGASMDTVADANAGQDLEMPGPARRMGDALLDAVRRGEVDEAVIDDKVRRLLRLLERTGVLDGPAAGAGDEPERSVDLPEHRELSRRAAADAIVLLRNDGDLLPLDAGSLRRIAVIGPNAAEATIMGGGSAQVKAHYRVDPLDAIRERCAASGVEVVHAVGALNHKLLPTIDPALLRPHSGDGNGLDAEYFAGPDFGGEPVTRRVSRKVTSVWFGTVTPGVSTARFSVRWTGTLTPTETGRHHLGLSAAGRSRVLIDGELVVDNWTSPRLGDTYFGIGTEPVISPVDLEAGRAYDITVECSRDGGVDVSVAGLHLGLLPPMPGDLLGEAVSAAAGADVAVVVAGTTAEWETEGSDRVSLALPGRQAELIRAVAAANPRTVVVVNTGSPVDVSWAGDVAAVLEVWFGGQELGHAVADVLFGDAEPGGRLPTTFPRRMEDTPAFLDVPGGADVVRYAEGVFVGHRWYDARAIEPAFPFGHGLTYTTFEYGPVRLSAEQVRGDEPVDVDVDVTNTGARPGSEVVQVYLGDDTASVRRPVRELAAFAKVRLAPGERRTVRLSVPPRARRFWDATTHRWVSEPGRFTVWVGASSRDLRGEASFELLAD